MHPLESTWEKVQTLKRKPMLVMSSDFEKRAGILSMLQSQTERSSEIRTIDKSLVKIAQLLALGFGEAGANMLVQNLEMRQDINVDIPGERVIAIYGFCDIRNFTDATEVLQTDVMSFVNSIAAIVHSTIVKCGGSPNKNIGDAFLFVWKLANSFDEPHVEDYIHPSSNSKKASSVVRDNVAVVADLSVYCIMKILAKTNSYQ